MSIKSIPSLGFGTWLLYGDECVRAVRWAIDAGYRHIDTAFAYENHRAIGEAIRGVPRDGLWITSKIGIGVNKGEGFRSDVKGASVEEACDTALLELGVDVLDALLIHWPNPEAPMADIFANMWRLVEKGKLRFPGVSNFTESQLQDLYDQGLEVPFNQVEVHPLLQQKSLRAFCQKNGTQVTAYRPFGKGDLLKDVSLFDEIGKSHGKSGAQVILRWFAQKGIPVIAKASKKQHIFDNIETFELTREEIAQIDALDRGKRYCEPDWSDFE